MRRPGGWTKRSGIMLCYPFEEKRLAKWEPPYIVQPKLNGERCRAIIDADGEVELLSSELNIVTGVPHIREQIKSLGLRNVEFDGELYRHGMPFSEIHSIVSRGEDNLRDDYELIQYHRFDLVTSAPQIIRTSNLLEAPETSHLKTVYSEIVEDLDSVISAVDNFVADGYEGIVVRNLSAPYVRKRSVNMMKWKPRKTDTYMIVDFREEVDKHGVPKGSLGAVICIGADDETFRVGSGFTQEQRRVLWEHRGELPGKFITVAYQNLTSKRGVPRNGVFKSFVRKGEEE